MGLDSVEILSKVEQTFGIEIPNQEAEKIITIGDFHDAVWSHVSGKHSAKCASQTLFYQLRASFNKEVSLSVQRVQLDTPPEELFPTINRRGAYLDFANKINVCFPALVLPKVWMRILTAFGFTSILGGLVISIILINIFNYSFWTLLIPVAGLLLTLLVSELLNPKRIIIEQKTMREFTQQVLALNYQKLTKGTSVNRREMESVINHIVAELSGLCINEISPDKKIADDLGID